MLLTHVFILYFVTIVTSILASGEFIPPILGYAIIAITLIRIYSSKGNKINSTLERYSNHYTIEKGRGDYLVLKIDNSYISHIPEGCINDNPRLKSFVYSKLIIEIEKIRRDNNLNNITVSFKKPG